MTLYRPIGKKEYDLIKQSNFKEFPPRLSWQPIFYPVLNKEYAEKIAKEWNTKDENSDYVGIVTEFYVIDEYIQKFEKHIVGSALCEELWIPAEELEEFNKNIRFTIKIREVFYGEKYNMEKIEKDYLFTAHINDDIRNEFGYRLAGLYEKECILFDTSDEAVVPCLRIHHCSIFNRK